MNYLAHFYLAKHCQTDECAGYMLGGLLGDFIKGPLESESNRLLLQNNRLPGSTRLGIALHRFIDANFDSLNDIRQIQRAHPKTLRRYGGILIDLAFDSILSDQWDVTQTEETLLEFEDVILTSVMPYADQLPAKAQRLLYIFNEHKILSRYGEKQVLEGTLLRIADRLKSTELASSVDTLWETKRSLLPHFESILKNMQTLTENFIDKNEKKP